MILSIAAVTASTNDMEVTTLKVFVSILIAIKMVRKLENIKSTLNYKVNLAIRSFCVVFF